MRPRDACPQLASFLGSYLHQDLFEDHDSAESALQEGISFRTPEELKAAAEELRTHRPPATDEEASSRFLSELDCDYYPPGDGLTSASWLDHLQGVLDRAAPG